MIKVNISVLKAKLSEYLGQVKRGQDILVMDRDTPVATITPAKPRRRLTIIPAKKDPRAIRDVKGIKLKQPVDVVKLLREDREDRTW